LSLNVAIMSPAPGQNITGPFGAAGKHKSKSPQDPRTGFEGESYTPEFVLLFEQVWAKQRSLSSRIA
jgi:hypothetical protein